MARYLIVTNDAWFFASHRLPIAKSLIARSDEVTIAARRDDKVGVIESSGCKFVDWDVLPRSKSIWGELRALFSLLQIVRRERPDVLHLVTVKPVLYGGLIGRLLGVPSCVYAISGLGAIFATDVWFARLVRYLIVPLYRFAIKHKNSVIIFQNTDDRELLRKILSMELANSQIIRGSGVDTDLFTVTPEPEGVPVVTLGARLLKDKGINEFIAAARMIKSRGLQASFQIAGGNVADGNPAALTEKEIDQIRQEGVVTMLGHVDDVADLFQRSNIIVLPSYREGLPKVLIEAGAAGRAIVTTDVPGCRDAVAAGESALLVPQRDAESLADAIADLLQDPGKRHRFGAAGRALVETTMHVDLIVEQHTAIYQRLADATSALQ